MDGACHTQPATDEADSPSSSIAAVGKEKHFPLHSVPHPQLQRSSVLKKSSNGGCNASP